MALVLCTNILTPNSRSVKSDFFRFRIFPPFFDVRSDTTRQHSLDYIERNFKKYSKYKDLPISDKCCDKLKKEPLRRKAKELGLECAILGILASESYQREKEWLEYGCNVFHIRKDNKSRPLSFWSDEDILEYISRCLLYVAERKKSGHCFAEPTAASFPHQNSSSAIISPLSITTKFCSASVKPLMISSTAGDPVTGFSSDPPSLYPITLLKITADCPWAL